MLCGLAAQEASIHLPREYGRRLGGAGMNGGKRLHRQPKGV